MMIFLITDPAEAMEVLLGTVQSVEPESGRIVLEISQNSDESENRDDPNGSEKITVQVDPERIPACVIVGRMIRVWGNYLNAENSQFKVLHISGSGFGNQKSDPTGVRSRIGRGMRGFKGGMRGRRGH
jgi:hypothetical protein